MNAVRQLSAVMIAALALCASALGATQAPASSEADQQCLGCHGQEGLQKTLDDGGTVALAVKGDAFARSAHAPLGCAACHSDVNVKDHPGKARKAASARAMSIALNESCGGCHQEITAAHNKSMHGRARDKEGTLPAPLCSTCHKVHELGPVVAGVTPRDPCLTCHAAAATHEKWLTNARKHLEVVACSACHSPGAQRKVDLRLQDATGAEFIATAALKGRATAFDAAGLRDFMKDINATGNSGGGKTTKVMMVGRMEAGDMVAAHGLAAKGKAVKDCATCHKKGADAFQKVTLSVLGSDGKRASYDAQKEVLHSPTSVDSVRGFYAMGGTRIQVLDILLGLALVGGISAPLGHMVMRKLSRRKEEAK